MRRVREVVPRLDIVESGSLTVAMQDCNYSFKAVFVYFEQLCIAQECFCAKAGIFMRLMFRYECSSIAKSDILHT